jgi:hypothetical protein
MKLVQGYLEELVADGDALLSELSGGVRKPGLDRRYLRWRTNLVEFLKYARLTSHLSEAKDILTSVRLTQTKKIENAIALLESAADLVSRGFVGNLKILVHAELYATTVDEARMLFEAGHHVPAAVLARIVLEGWLRDQAEGAGLQTPENLKASQVNDELRKAGVFSMPKWRQVQVYLDVGNAAAHGRVEEVSPDEIGRLLAFAEANYA